MESQVKPTVLVQDEAVSPALLEKQRKFFRTGKTRSVAFRIEQLRKLKQAIKAHEAEILDALKADLGKAPFESYAAEMGLPFEEINHTIKHLHSWAAPDHVDTPLVQFLSSAKIYHEPLGQVLIIAPWNYPFQLTIAPLIGAIAGGNTVVLKPSEISAHTSRLVAKIIRQIFPEEYVAVVQGGIQVNQQLLEHRWDHVFFTGSPTVGKIVMQAAARHLTPVTLELGGKSPCIVDRKVNVKVAASRIVWGKFFNTGQTCIAPDYLLVHKDVKDSLLAEMQKEIINFYGEDAQKSPDYGRIINEKHFLRITGYLADGDIYYGGKTDPSERYISPTILTNVSPEAPIMQDEIFGPLLPVLEYTDLDQAITFVNSRPHPLALYLFTTSEATERKVLDNTHSGGGCVNDTLVHLSFPDAPFGGVGNSGMGQYHGKWSFETFTHARTILKKANFPDSRLRYAPYKDKLKLIKLLMK
jgi:aldehyde dehydrogenase (NAD+)